MWQVFVEQLLGLCGDGQLRAAQPGCAIAKVALVWPPRMCCRVSPRLGKRAGQVAVG
jgi:hypothetical protein